eukprot:CAMPEP_0171108984 /NCGR_PEP_ID=MMETSP0766_2-20121228/70016_1 /TAXON_ID=439317 /ORGANISM="Gambierdiscus australes, Strain CAWD 149" /LENGTH=69 /DNA_ID=CAMNT_0011570621 /DNA_START=122 /DNA_END=327 /DNA_ORIENTATION=+
MNFFPLLEGTDSAPQRALAGSSHIWAVRLAKQRALVVLRSPGSLNTGAAGARDGRAHRNREAPPVRDVT